MALHVASERLDPESDSLTHVLDCMHQGVVLGATVDTAMGFDTPPHWDGLVRSCRRSTPLRGDTWYSLTGTWSRPTIIGSDLFR